MQPRSMLLTGTINSIQIQQIPRSRSSLVWKHVKDVTNSKTIQNTSLDLDPIEVEMSFFTCDQTSRSRSVSRSRSILKINSRCTLSVSLSPVPHCTVPQAYTLSKTRLQQSKSTFFIIIIITTKTWPPSRSGQSCQSSASLLSLLAQGY